MESYLIDYLVVIKKFSQFTGRAARKEFWNFTVINIIVGIALGLLGRIPILGVIFSIASALFYVAVFIPSIAVGMRRLHDTNRSGYFLLIALIPFIGIFILLALCALEGTPDENQYGPNPGDYISDSSS